jgi:hypothetical protein
MTASIHAGKPLYTHKRHGQGKRGYLVGKRVDKLAESRYLVQRSGEIPVEKISGRKKDEQGDAVIPVFVYAVDLFKMKGYGDEWNQKYPRKGEKVGDGENPSGKKLSYSHRSLFRRRVISGLPSRAVSLRQWALCNYL